MPESEWEALQVHFQCLTQCPPSPTLPPPGQSTQWVLGRGPVILPDTCASFSDNVGSWFIDFFVLGLDSENVTFSKFKKGYL